MAIACNKFSKLQQQGIVAYNLAPLVGGPVSMPVPESINPPIGTILNRSTGIIGPEYSNKIEVTQVRVKLEAQYPIKESNT